MRRGLLSECIVSCYNLSSWTWGSSHGEAIRPKMVVASYRPLFEIIQLCLAGLSRDTEPMMRSSQHAEGLTGILGCFPYRWMYLYSRPGWLLSLRAGVVPTVEWEIYYSTCDWFLYSDYLV